MRRVYYDSGEYGDNYYEECYESFVEQEPKRNMYVSSDYDYVKSDDECQLKESIPPVPIEDVKEPEILHLATLYTTEGLDEAVWAALPDALVDRMLARLPPAAFAHLRSVCKRWNELPWSSRWLRQYADITRRLSFTMMCHTHLHFSYVDSPSTPSALVLPLVPVRNEFFFCHFEQKWFGMPPVGIFQEEGAPNWKLADVDWGLVCYACYDSGLPLCVTNPLTNAATLLSPPSLGGSLPGGTLPKYKFVKLVVDRQSKTYKIVVLLCSSKPPSTLVYDSASALWTVIQCYPPFDPLHDRDGGSFLWKRTIFMRCDHPGVLLAFDADTEAWEKVDIEFCPDRRFWYDFVSKFDKLMIIRSYFGPLKKTRPPSVLMLKDDAASPNPLFRGNVWVEMDVHNCAYLQKVASVARCDTSHNDYLIFTNPDEKEWVTYTFSTRTWQKMPIPVESYTQYSWGYDWYDWEPRWDM